MSQKTASAVFLFMAAISASHLEEFPMGMAFWLSRFLVVFVGAFIVIGAGQLLKGHGVEEAARHAVLWATISGSVFVAGRMYQSARGQHCVLCRDTPEMREGGLS